MSDVWVTSFDFYDGHIAWKEEIWPSVPYSVAYIDAATTAAAAYIAGGYTYAAYIQTYTAFNDYLNFSADTSFHESASMQMDAVGVPQSKIGGVWYYSPVTVMQYALMRHGRYVNDDEDATNFIAAADRLLLIQDTDGAFRYPYAFSHSMGVVLPVGLVSGMAQGHALSVFARAYHTTGDSKYLTAGEKAFEFMVLPIANGGTEYAMTELDASLNGYTIIEEYITAPATYTLNGFMFTMLGIWDWAQVTESSLAKAADALFYRCVHTLKRILPYYDVGGFTSYDLRQITNAIDDPLLNAGYHRVHIYLLHALYTITNEPILLYYKNLWASYVAT